MIKAIKYFVVMLFFLTAMSCELSDRKEFRTIIKVSGEIGDMVKVKE
jgi:hypothetical protein